MTAYAVRTFFDRHPKGAADSSDELTSPRFPEIVVMP